MSHEVNDKLLDTIYDEIRNVDAILVSTTDPTCAGYVDGQATASATGGIGSYTYKWSDAGAQTTATATGLSAGTYYCVITDSIGQFDTLFNVILNDPAPLAVVKLSSSNGTLNITSCELLAPA